MCRVDMEHLEQVQLCFHHLHSRIMLHSTCSLDLRILCLCQVCEMPCTGNVYSGTDVDNDGDHQNAEIGVILGLWYS